MLTRLRTAIVLVGACATAFGDTLVVPNAQANTPGNAPVKLGVKGQRIQEIVGSGQFTAPIVITGIHVRSAVGTGPASFNNPSFKITLSTTQAFPNTNNGHALPSLTYATNVGPDATTVYNTALSGSSPGCSGPAPCPFDIAVPFSTPFSYDPNKGRLLVDFVTSAASGTPTGSLDGVQFPDTTSSTVVVVGGDPTQAAGTLNLAGFVFGLDIVGSAAPGISSVANAATNRGFASPIAQGSIFVIKGSGLGPTNISIAPAAFQSTSLSGTSVAVTVGTTTVNALMYYTSASQVAALLPSNTPTGAGMFTVTYNGQASNSVGHGIVASNLGIFTVNSSGQGPGIVTYPDYSLVSAAKAANCGGPNTTCGAANPGDTLIIWATGLGPVSGDDASGAGLGQNMPNLPLKLWLGGVQAPVIYQGRSGCCIGEDQIVFTVPNNVPTGCAVPLVVQINNQISNSTLMPVANGSRNCNPNNPALASVNVEQAVMAGPVTFGGLDLDKRFNDNSPGYFDQANLTFARVPSYPPGSQPFFASYIDDQPLGTCIVYDNTHEVNGAGSYLFSNIAPLDAGSSFTVKGPSGSMNLAGTPGQTRTTLSAAGTFLVPGSYTITGTGGKDVGPFSATITFPASPTLVSPLSANGLTVTRSNGMTVTWRGGDPNGHVEIVLESAIDNMFNTGASAACTAPTSAGTFTIPPYVLLALPTGNFTHFGFGPGTVAAATAAPFTATGLNVGVVDTFIESTGFGGFALN
jgi:uncharacterized protein (TIGR03437 family)